MNELENEHDWFTEQIATALAGGLSEAERARFDAHANECTPCGAALAEAKMTDGSMAGFLSDLRPPDGLENRIIGRLRSSRRILRLPGINHPMVIRAATAAAAVILVGTTGWIGTRIIEKGKSANPVTDLIGILSASPANQPVEAAKPKVAYVPNGSTQPAGAAEFNFENAPIGTALNYLSQQFGFIVIPEVPISGRVTLLSKKKVTADEALAMLNTALRVDSYAAVRQGDMVLKIVSIDKVKKDGIPVHFGTDPNQIADSDETITQVMPLRSMDAVKMKTDLAPLVDSEADFTSSPGGNSLIITDTSSRIKRLAKIVNEMDNRATAASDEKALSGAGDGRGGGGLGGGGGGFTIGGMAGDKSRLASNNSVNDSYALPTESEPQASGEREAYGLKTLPGGTQGTPPAAPALATAVTPAFANYDAQYRGSNITINGGTIELGTSTPALTGMNAYNGTLSSGAAGGGRRGGGGVGGGGQQAGVPIATELGTGMPLTSRFIQTNAGSVGGTNLGSNGPVALDAKGAPAEAVAPGQALPDYGAQDISKVAPAANLDRRAYQFALDDTAGKKKQPADAPPQPASAAQPQMPPTSQPSAMADRKIIRSGTMRFEVENFDSADRRLREIVRESGGYIGSADSTRLPNGKVQGTITIRVPPENLDVLVLGLRALGDLQEQQIGAQDITKEYTDLQSELRAAKAMEDRLLEIIHTGNAQVKDLLAVEKELGTWREKVEQVTGQINYYNNLVSLSTLTVTLSEKDINQAATATETETINTGLEADDVSHARDEVIKAVEAAKGRIIQSDLNEQQAGQFTATVVALLPADTGGPIIDHLRQLGRVTRLESTRKQTINGQQAPENVKVNRHDTQLQLSIFNVNAFVPRTSDNLALACTDVESAYHSILDFVSKSDHARVVESNLTRPSPDATTGVISFEVRESSADATLAFLRSLGVSRSLAVTENRDVDSVTSSKRGFNIVLNPVNGIPAQETVDMTVLPQNGDLLATYTALLDLANQPDIKARIIDKDLQQANGMYTSAAVEMEIARDKLDMAQQKITAAGKVVARKSTRQPDSANVIDTKVMLKFNFVNVDALEPRQTLVRSLAAAAAPAAYQTILDAARAAGAWIRSADLRVQPGQSTVGELDFYLPASKQGTVQDVIEHSAILIGQSTNRAAEGDATTEAKVRYQLQVYQIDQLSPRRIFSMEIQTPKAEAAAADVTTSALAAGGQVLEHSTRTDPDGRGVTHLVLVAPLEKSEAIAAAARTAGTLIKDESTENTQAPAGAAARARLEIEFSTEPSVVADNNGLFAAIKQGLTTSIRGLLWSVQILVIGLCLIVPWVVAGWAGWRWTRRARKLEAKN